MKLVRYGDTGAERPGLIDHKACCATCPVTSQISTQARSAMKRWPA
jgi:hypothetical protein